MIYVENVKKNLPEKIKCFFLIGLFGTVPVQVNATLIKEHVTYGVRIIVVIVVILSLR